MSMRVPCPQCGLRDQEEFRFGGELRSRPQSGADKQAWADYLYLRKNVSGEGEEWWFHRLGCGSWFTLKRNTLSHKISPSAKA